MIKFIDFLPQILKKAKLFKGAEFESMESVIDRLNKWQNENRRVEILSIETVVLPNIHNSREEGSEDTDLLTSGEMATTWHQFIRVWYRE